MREDKKKGWTFARLPRYVILVIAKPVVLGVSSNDGRYYEVLAGIEPGERIIVGEIPG